MTGLDFILVEPGQAGNVGTICRALKTMGFGPPKIIGGAEGLEKSGEAQKLAHGAREFLEGIERPASIAEVKRSYGFLVGTTARRRRTVGEYVELRRLPGLLSAKGSRVGKVAILFGSEASGLSSEVLHQCELISTVPLSTTYPSLNLAQAVLLYAYELAGLKHAVENAEEANREGSYRALLGRIDGLLSKEPGNVALRGRVRERLAYLEAGDIALMHSLLNTITKQNR